MDSLNKEWLRKLAKEANERYEQFREFICQTEELPKLAEWARNWRKQYIEPNYYACKVKLPDKAKLVVATPETARKTSSVNSIASKLPAAGDKPAISCSIRKERKN